MIWEKKWSDCAESTWQFPVLLMLCTYILCMHSSTWYCVTVGILKNCSPSRYFSLFHCHRQLVSVRSWIWEQDLLFFFILSKVAEKHCLDFVIMHCWWRSTCFPISFTFFWFLSIFLYLGISTPCLPNGCSEETRTGVPSMELEGISSAENIPLWGSRPWVFFPLVPN